MTVLHTTETIALHSRAHRHIGEHSTGERRTRVTSRRLHSRDNVVKRHCKQSKGIAL